MLVKIDCKELKECGGNFGLQSFCPEPDKIYYITGQRYTFKLRNAIVVLLYYDKHNYWLYVPEYCCIPVKQNALFEKLYIEIHSPYITDKDLLNKKIAESNLVPYNGDERFSNVESESSSQAVLTSKEDVKHP